jgi:hypothetical protein
VGAAREGADRGARVSAMLFIWLSLFLDLQPPVAATAPPGLSVRAELLDDTTYRIVHTWRGARAMRFVTGATDRNCEDPVDVLIADRTFVELRSNLPCGGFAFTSVRKVAPGESWTIEGAVSLPVGTRRVVARYCPKDLRGVDPAQKAVGEPPWWLGCVDAEPVIASADAALAGLLDAMANGAPVAPWTTPAGLASLRAGLHGEAEASAFARWATGWSAWEARKMRAKADRKTIKLGPVAKEHAFVFTRTAAGWQLDRWTPGE